MATSYAAAAAQPAPPAAGAAPPPGPVIQGGVRADVLPALQAQLPGARIVLRKRSVQRAPALLELTPTRQRIHNDPRTRPFLSPS